MKSRFCLKGNFGGFTLVEILVVVAIIGLLVTIAVRNYANDKRRANDSNATVQLRNLALSMESYFVDNQAYTTTLTALSGYTPSASINVSVSSADPATAWNAIAYHAAGNNTYTWISNGGGLQP